MEYELRPLDATFDILLSQLWIRHMARRTSLKEIEVTMAESILGIDPTVPCGNIATMDVKLCKWRQAA